MWQINSVWNSIYIESSIDKDKMQTNRFEEFIFEYYYGYTKIDNLKTEEYKVNHPQWKINKVANYKINCDFDKMYENHFLFKKTINPNSVFLAEELAVSAK